MPDAELADLRICRRARCCCFAFGGYEVIPVPAGESRDPRRDVPFALIMTIVVVTAARARAGGRPGDAAGAADVEDAAGRCVGAAHRGAAAPSMITLGAVLSTLGNNMGQAAVGIAQPVRARRAGRPAAVLRPRAARGSARRSSRSSSPPRCRCARRLRLVRRRWRRRARSAA